MADSRNVCCMCGDIGFPDKLFQCLRCLFRFQHSYCSNYYREESSTDPTAGVCDWCKSEEHRAHSRRPATAGAGNKASRHGGGDRDDGGAGGSRGRSSGAGPPSSSSSSSAKQSGRRYKLLKDVLC